MMRLKSVSTISLIVIIACAAWLAATAWVRANVGSWLGEPGDPRLRREVQKHPNDAQTWFALAAYPGHPPGTAPPDLPAFDRVFELKPAWAAGYLALGARLVGRTPLVWRPELAVLNRRFAEEAERQQTPLTPDQRETIARARAALDKARSLDPANAAPDYLLAFLALTEHRDPEALALLRSGAAKNVWSIGEREANVALYETALRSMIPLQAFLMTVEVSSSAYGDVYARLRELARVVTGMARSAAQRGDAERAIFLREAVMHLGRIMMARAYTVMDVLVGEAIWTIGTSEPLTAAEEQAVFAGLPHLGAGKARGAAIERRNHALAEAKQAKFAQYLRQHGRADLATQMLATSRSLTTRIDEVHAAVYNRTLDSLYEWLYGLMGFVGALLAACTGVFVLLICGLGLLLVSRRGQRPAPIIWPRWKWAVVVLACLGAGYGVWFAGMLREPYSRSRAPGAAAAALAVSVPVLVVWVTFVVRHVRRRIALSERPGFGRQYVATLAQVFLPVTALLLLITVAESFAAANATRKFIAHQKTMIYQGELEYLGLKPPVILTK